MEKMIEQLREAYGKIERVDPCQPTYGKLCSLLDGLDTDQLELIAMAEIKWVSSLANNRIMRRLFE